MKNKFPGFANRLKSLLEEMKVPKGKFAASLGVKPSHITNLLKGESNPSDRLIKSMAKEYSVNEEWLRTGIGERVEPGKISLIRIEPLPTIPELLKAAEQILTSDTDYGRALAQNIRTFHRGYLLEKREPPRGPKAREDHDLRPPEEGPQEQ